MEELPRYLDLGCGTNVTPPPGYEGWGVDIVDVGSPNVKQADLIFDPIPYPDNYFDLIGAYDFIEHIPMVVYCYNPETRKMERRNSMIALFNEIYRVLKPLGEFFMLSPLFPHRAVFQDPTHVSFWTGETIHYFSGDYYGFHDHYGHTSRFELLQNEVAKNHGVGLDSHISIRLRARKDILESEPYRESYVTRYPWLPKLGPNKSTGMSVNKQIKIEYNDCYEQARTYYLLGKTALDQRQWEQCEQYYQQILQTKIEYKDHYTQADINQELGVVAYIQEHWEPARDYYLQALKMFVDYRDDHKTSVTLGYLTLLWQASGDTGLPAAVAPILGSTSENVEELLSSALASKAKK